MPPADNLQHDFFRCRLIFSERYGWGRRCHRCRRWIWPDEPASPCPGPIEDRPLFSDESAASGSPSPTLDTTPSSG